MFTFDLLVHMCPGNKSFCPAPAAGSFHGALLRREATNGLMSHLKWDILEVDGGTYLGAAVLGVTLTAVEK